MRTVVRLLEGDKRNPRRALDLNAAGGSIRLATFEAGPGDEDVVWSGRNPRRDGERPVAASRGNAQAALTYHLEEAGSAAELAWLQSQVTRFMIQAGRYERDRQGEPIWVEYGWADGLEDLPAPAFGQFRQYLGVLHGASRWPQRVQQWLRARAIDGVVASLVCQPLAEGLEDRAGTGIGQLELVSGGLLIPNQVTNLCTNPSFGHATWNTDWAVSDAALKATQETRADFTRSLNSAAHLVNLSTSVRQFRQTLTLTAANYIISCYVRRPDGEAVTSSDMTLWGQAASRTPTFVAIDGGPWYLAYAVYTAAASSSTHGVQMAVGREVFIDDVQIATAASVGGSTFATPLPFCAGHLIGCAWSGTAHASSSSRPQPYLKWTLTNELSGEYTVAGWIRPHWTDDGPTLYDPVVFQYYVDADNYLGVYFETNNDRFEIAGYRNGTSFSGAGSGRTIAMFDNIHLALVQDISTLKLYVNGAEDISINTAVGIPASGVFYLGCSGSTTEPITGAVDGWKIWQLALSATQVDTLYDNELPVKQAYGNVGLPPFLWTKDGDKTLDRVDDSDQDNFCIVAGVPGDVEAETEWRVAPDTGTTLRVFWLARKAVDACIKPDATFYIDLSGAADANSSGGAYEAHTEAGAATYYHYGSLTQSLMAMRGRVQAVGRLYVTTAAVTVRPFYHLGGAGTESFVYGESQSIATDANFLFRDFGDLIIDFPFLDDPLPNGLNVGLELVSGAGGVTTWCDFIHLLPYPLCRIEAVAASITISSGDLLIVKKRRAWITSSTYAHERVCEYNGDEVNVEPKRYNYVWILRGEEGQQYVITPTMTVTCYVTPRWLLPGAAVG